MALINQKSALLEKLSKHREWTASLGRSGTQLRELDLIFEDLDLSLQNLSEIEVPGSSFIRVTLKETDFYAGNIAGSQFRNIDLTEACFVKTNLSYTDFSGACLAGANMRRADLHEANFTGAVLDGVDLRGAYLIGTIFTGASMNNCDLTRAHLDAAATATLPEGFRSSPRS